MISKSRFVSGCQCRKKLYFDIHCKDLKPPVDEKRQALFDAGHEIGHLAHRRFPNGLDASPKDYADFSTSFEKTSQWISDGMPTIYEAAFHFDGAMAALDILHHEGSERWAIEVKSSSGVKDYHLQDAALQYWVMHQSGVAPDRFFLMHINADYVLDESIDVHSFFNLADITDHVKAKQEWVTENLASLKNTLSSPNPPDIEIGKHCTAPFACDYMRHCWIHIPENSVFNLSYARGKDWKLYENGITELSSIPEEYALNHKQRLQVEGAKSGQTHIDADAIRNFLSGWIYPLYFFDFETVSAPVPIINRTRPFQQLPFQYSLHILQSNGDLRHTEFLANADNFITVQREATTDPRIQLIQQMKADIGPIGHIVSYNASFEIKTLKTLAIDFPEERAFLESLIERFVDLLVVFRKAWYYKPEMGGSASIKYVLPAIAPAFSYADLPINNGGDASQIFLSMLKGTFDGDIPTTREHLLRYCERDSLGMVILYQELLKII